jgi:hypothetical protein
VSEKIVTTYWAKPIPDRRFDWSATSENYDASWEGEETGWWGSHPIGYGATEEEAIADYKAQMEDRKEIATPEGG